MTTLYLKYRPQKLDELDLEQVREGLKEIAKSGNFPHALLFSGPRGTGKTSAARIIAKVVNCTNRSKTGEPCNRCTQCTSIISASNLDVIELDGASNRGIDDIRSLRDKIMLAPSKATKKVYIIDEAHMLTTEAANAFLKTLEEPPDHVMFILATTDPQKLPETVRSRLTTISFGKAKFDEIERQLKRVIKGEKITADGEIIKLIANRADGSFRDAVKLLEQLTVGGKRIAKKKAYELLTDNLDLKPDHFIELLSSGDVKQALMAVEEMVNNGGSVKAFSAGLVERLREGLLAAQGLPGERIDSINSERLIGLIELISECSRQFATSPVPQLSLEIAIIKWAGDSDEKVNPVEEVPQNPEKLVKQDKSTALKSSAVPVKKKNPVTKGSKKVDENTWRQILSDVRNQNTTIEALLRAAKPIGFDGATLDLGVFYQFHKEKLEVNNNRRTLEDVCTSIFGSPVRISYQLTQRESQEVPKKQTSTETGGLTDPVDEDIISAAKEIFGS